MTMNQMRVWLLMGVMTVLLVGLGNALGGSSGSMLFFFMALVMNGITYFYSDKLAIRMTGSKPLDQAEAPEIYSMVRSARRPPICSSSARWRAGA